MRAPVAPKGWPSATRAAVHVEARGIHGADGFVTAEALAGEGVADAEHLQHG
jgi:hypothetical protein